MKRLLGYILIIGFAFACQRLSAQQTPQWTQYILNKYAINPAFGGLEQSLSITTGIRSQWNQFPGSPKTQIINAHLPLYFLKGSAGMSLINDQTGALRRTIVSASYNYVHDASWGLLSVGLRVGGQQVRLDGRALRTPDGVYIDQTFDHLDPRLSATDVAGFSPIWSLGLYYIKDALEVGLTLDNTPGSNIEAGATRLSNSSAMSFFASYQYDVTDDIAVVPNVFVKSESGQTQVDIGALGYYQQFFGGLGLRGLGGNSLDALGIIAGTKLSPKLRISYSFDIGLSDLGQFHDGSHEFIVNYNLQRPIKTGELPKIIYNPRYK